MEIVINGKIPIVIQTNIYNKISYSILVLNLAYHYPT